MSRGKYLTPETLSGAVVCRPLFVPVELLPHVSGALEVLAFAYNWEEHGAIGIDDTVSAVRSMIDTFYEGCESGEFNLSELTREKSLPYFNFVVQTGGAIVQTTLQIAEEVRLLYQQVGPAINDKLRYPIWLDAGLYKITLLGSVGANRGIQHLQIGGTDYALFDWYNGISMLDIYQSGYFPVAAAGVVNIDLLVSTKNAASTAYTVQVERFWIEKI